ncbi:hypothetical protein [Streptomyces sp. NPDC048442]|uniref:hypothetical protein n=1 Tax=Streptomyces sp. NPDC048442 TaxID=3154823 RepID=UPI003430D642
MKSLSDPVRICEVLTGAGFERITVTPVADTTVWGRDPADAADFLLSRPATGRRRRPRGWR